MNAEPELPPASDYNLVPAITVDSDTLVRFAAAVWPDRPPREQVLSPWWRRADPACAAAAIEAATGAMAALCMVRPAAWMIAGQQFPASAICNWFVVPAHAGKGLGKRLVRHFAELGGFFYGFSISDAAAANLRTLGWKGPFVAHLLALPLPRLARLPLALLAARSRMDLEDHAVAGGEPLGDLGRDLDAIETRHRDGDQPRMRRDATEWAWRLSVCRDHTYYFTVARIGGAAVGYVVVRRTMPSSALGGLAAAIVADLVAVDDDPMLLRALAFRAVEIAAGMRVRLLLTVATRPPHRGAYAATGFASSGFPLLGRVLARHSPAFMWSPEGPGARFVADDAMLTFADSDADLHL
jgi:GNAT superfamily N-acetyltransferase